MHARLSSRGHHLRGNSRGNNHRKKEEGWPPAPVEGEKGRKAEQHDKLVQMANSKAVLLELVERHARVMENLGGGLEKVYYMMDWNF